MDLAGHQIVTDIIPTGGSAECQRNPVPASSGDRCLLQFSACIFDLNPAIDVSVRATPHRGKCSMSALAIGACNDAGGAHLRDLLRRIAEFA